jgi:hypothetical protein
MLFAFSQCREYQAKEACICHEIQKAHVMEGPKETKDHMTDLLKQFPSWFAVLVGVIYGSGFLCVFTFLDRFGIQETGGDFFRVKYIHVGILYLLLPISILAPLAVVWRLKGIQDKLKRGFEFAGTAKQEKQPNEGDKSNGEIPHRRIHETSFLMFLNMGWVFYFYILFTPRNFLSTSGKECVLPAIFLVSLVGPRLIEKIADSWIVPHKSENFDRFARLVLFVLIVGPLDYWAIYGLFGQMWKVLWGDEGFVPSGAIYYLMFMILIPYTLWRANNRSKQIELQKGRTELRMAAICLCFMFYFLGIIAFGLRVYPFVPVAKGGGDYTQSPCVTLNFRSGIGFATNDPVFLGLTASNCYVIIEQTPTSFFLANTNDAGGPSRWRIMRQSPRIFEVRRDTVETIAQNQIP